MDNGNGRDKYIGKRLEGRYEIQNLIGMGGMANVYKAYDIIDERTVAVKILREEYLGNTEFLRRFRNESKAIAVLSHPNIVRVYDVSFTGNVNFIVMEHIDGITLKDYIERQSVLTWKEAVHFTLQILRALQHAHDKGIVHRDIKPHNIMLLQNGAIKVTDFGIARFARSEVKTVTDRAIGSVHYISPEQAMGEATDEKSDLYSVGVMLFEMLTGRLPFEADTAVSVAIKQIQAEAVRPTLINPSIPEGLEHITMRAMQKDAVKRYQSAAEMIADIEKFKEDPTTLFHYKPADAGTGGGRGKLRRGRRDKDETGGGRDGEDGEYVRRRRTPYIPILTGVTLAFVLASAGFIFLMLYMNNPFVQTDEYEVPDLINMKFETAVASHDYVEIVADGEWEYSNEFPKGVIMEQRPKFGGVSIKEGATIKVKVSNGPRVVTMLDYSRQDAMQVMQKLQEEGLEPTEVQENSTEVPAGSVIYTDPSKGSELSPGAAVTVYVSIGPKDTLKEVPGDIIGMTVDEANRFLEFYSLRIGNVSEEFSEKKEGTIIAVDPGVGTMQPSGTSLNVVVAKTKAPGVSVTVPLPPMKEIITVRARLEDNSVLAQAQLDPRRDDFWTFEVEGDPGEVLDVRVFISTETQGGKLYQRFMVDIDSGMVELHTDNSDNALFR